MGLFYGKDKKFRDILDTKKNFIFIGEAGSGKSEIALNVAAFLAEKRGERVDLFDLDQSKPLFRSRDLEDRMKDEGVDIHYQTQYLDAPTSVGGVSEALMGDRCVVLDIGGGENAARIGGCYAHLLKDEDSVAVYVVNPYRPWTKSIEAIDGTMSAIVTSVRLDSIYVLGNPNLGCFTSAEEVIEGIGKADGLLADFVKVPTSCVKRDLYDEVKGKTEKDIFPIDLYLTYEWADR